MKAISVLLITLVLFLSIVAYIGFLATNITNNGSSYVTTNITSSNSRYSSASTNISRFSNSNSSGLQISQKLRIALVKPIFTTTAYSSFYAFFSKYATAGSSITTDLNLLNTTLVDGWGYSQGLFDFINSSLAWQAGVRIGNNTHVITDIDVDGGYLFYPGNDSRRFDVLILGFSEYVTANEYQSNQKFVASGGRMILVSGDSFVAEVRYYASSNKLALVEGHGWIFNGTAASPGPFHRWYSQNTNWVGSNFALSQSEGYKINGAIANTSNPLSVLLREKFGKVVFTTYLPHQENIITNSTDSVIAYWNVSGGVIFPGVVATYQHNYQDGVVINFGVFGTDIIAQSYQAQFFLLAAIDPFTL